MTSAANSARPAPATKAARQARIVAILAREQVHSQEQLAVLLDQYAGMHVTQATLSRDLDELGVVRLRSADGTLIYALPGGPGGHGSPAGTALDYPERAVVSLDRGTSSEPIVGQSVPVEVSAASTRLIRYLTSRVDAALTSDGTPCTTTGSTGALPSGETTARSGKSRAVPAGEPCAPGPPGNA